MTSFTSRTTAASTATARFALSSRVPAGAAALMLSVSALAMTSGTALADCQPLAPTGGADAVTCDAVGVDNSPYSALGGDDTIDIIGGVYGGDISGGDGDDTITLNGGTLSLDVEGDAGNDTINLVSGSAQDASGGTGNDTITLNGASLSEDIFGDQGDDTIILLSGSARDVTGSSGNNTITMNGASLSGEIRGNSGDDTINILAGTVSGDVNGLVGSDTITMNGGFVGGDVTGGTGNDDIDIFGGIITGSVLGGTGDDTITLDGASINGNISANDGNDTINLLSGTATDVFGGNDNDTITLNGASVRDLYGDFFGALLGDDVINLMSGTADRVFGDGGNDTITLSGASITSQIDSGIGDDVIDLLAGTVDNVFGEAGADTITLDGATVTGVISGGLDNDTIDLLSGLANNVVGDSGADTITLDGATVTTFINGGLDNDTINLLSGLADNVNGNEGADTITLDGAAVTDFIDGGIDNDTIDLLSGVVDNVLGGTGDDTITLDGAAVFGNIDGDDGDDIIDLLSGSAANVIGDNGIETGNDIITLNGAVIAGQINGGNGNDVIDLLSGTAGSVSGSNGDDTITLNGATITNGIDGSNGNDVIDLLAGTAGSVNASNGDDTITLNGATIIGSINGSNGNDIIDLLSGTAGSVNASNGADTITLNGATIIGSINSSNGDDTIDLVSGSFGGNVDGGDGSDNVDIAATFDLSTIGPASLLDGGDDADIGDGFEDVLDIEASGTLIGNNLVNWETIILDGVDLTLLGNALTTEVADGYGIILANSILDLDDGFAITGDLNIGGNSTLVVEDGAGTYSVSDDIRNSGTIDMSDGIGPDDTLSMDDYFATSGELLLDVALNATEAGDSLVIADIVSGVTEITFTDTDPGGDPSFTGTGPGNGIVVVDNSLGGVITAGSFVFDPVAHPTNEILKVPFVYTLSLENDDILYLQSDVLAQVYGYAILSEMMRDQFPTLRDRLGDMRYNGYDSEGNPELGLDNAGLWARIDGSKRDIEHDGGHNTGEWNDTRGEASIGIDIPMETFGGVGVFGVSIHAVRGYADANSGLTPDPNVAEVDTTGFGGGLSFAWFPGGGFYADVQGRVTGWDADVENEARDLKQDIDGLGWGASLEVGNRFQIASNTAIIPRGQVVYTDVDFDSFKDDDGVDVSQDDSASVVIGPGVTIEQMFPDNGVAMFLDASVKHELLDESSIDASGFRFKSGLEDTWGTVSFGASLGVAEGASAYVAGDVSSPLTSTFGDSYGYGLRAGVRIDF